MPSGLLHITTLIIYLFYSLCFFLFCTGVLIINEISTSWLNNVHNYETTKKQQWQDEAFTWHTPGHTVHPAGNTELYECSDSGCSAERPHTVHSLEGRSHTRRSAGWLRNPPDTLTHMFAVWSETGLEEGERANIITAAVATRKIWNCCCGLHKWLTDLVHISYTDSSLLQSRTHRTDGSPRTLRHLKVK